MVQQKNVAVEQDNVTYRPLEAFCNAFSTSASLTASRDDVASMKTDSSCYPLPAQWATKPLTI
jgi:hypothetical protein